jgi:hypothetical protein
MDWTGLLNWSMNYTDGTRPSEFKVMDEETKKWLKEALETYVVDDVEVLKKGTKILEENETGSEDEQANKEHAAELIVGIIENLDTPLNLVKIDGFKHIIRCMIGSRYSSVRKLCASIFSTSVQNNPPVQKNAIENHALEGLCSIIPVEADLGLKEQYVSCLSGLVRGEFPLARENFIEGGGIKLIHGLIISFQSLRIVKKSLLMLSDILYNSMSKGDEKTKNLCQETGVLELVSQLANNQDHEIADMAQWVIHNSMIKTQ